MVAFIDNNVIWVTKVFNLWACYHLLEQITAPFAREK